MDKEKCRKLLFLAEELAANHTDKGLDQAIDILTGAIDEGCQDPRILVTAANYLLQSARATRPGIGEKALELASQAVALAPESIPVLEEAVACFELRLDDYPEKLEDVLKLYLKILDLNPDHIEAMLILANHREHPCVRLSLEDAIGMLEWAKQIDPANHFVAFTLARLYVETGKLQEAKDLYEQINSSSSDDKSTAINTPELNRSTKPATPKPKRVTHRRLSRN
jgi:tetratricopeptide (TPR) repeat protein